jgi:acetolactate synthase I/II/III large subunit
MSLSGGDILLDLLQKNGIEYIFCSPGTEWTSIWEGILKRHGQGDTTLDYINCRHEMLAVSAAMGYAQSTGKLPAVLLHSGAGTLHGSMALRNAYMAQAPMIVFSGETYEHSGDPGLRPQGPHWIGLLSDNGGPSSLVSGFTKWSRGVQSLDALVDSVYRGCRMARTAPQGPVFISILSELLQKSYAQSRASKPFPLEVPGTPEPSGLTEVAEQLVRSLNPVIIAENAGKRPGVTPQLIELAELLNAPVYESLFPFCSSFPKEHPLYQGFEATSAIQEADTVLVVGSTTPWYPPATCLRPGVKVIWLDEASLHEKLPYWGYQFDISLTADIQRGLAVLIETIRSQISGAGTDLYLNRERLERWQAKHNKLLESWKAEAIAAQNNQPVSSKWLAYTASRVFPQNALIYDETMMHFRFINRYLAAPGRYTRCGYGGIGVGLGEAAGAKLANPDKPVVLFIGDGAFNYNPVLAGLGLCQEYHLPLLVVIMNNGGYIAMRLGHNNLFPEGWAATHNTYLGVDIAPAPDYTRLAEAFGAYGEKVEKPEDVEGALRRGLQQLAQGRTALLDISVSTP